MASESVCTDIKKSVKNPGSIKHPDRPKPVPEEVCGLCITFVNALRTPYASYRRVFGGIRQRAPYNEIFGYSYAEFQTNGCSGLKELTNECLKYLDEKDRRKGSELVLAKDPGSTNANEPTLFALWVVFRLGDHGFTRYPGMQLTLAHGADVPQNQAHGRILDSSWVDMAQVKQWKQTCLSRHGQKCDNPWMIKKAEPALLIDTFTNALVKGAGGAGYVALSYRWASKERLKNTKANYSTLLQPGSLTEKRSSISPIILDAMRLVRDMGERYLWVDALCIVQDDEKTRTPQLELMGAIYASSVITIMATDGDAEYGLPGIPGGNSAAPNKRNLKQPVYTLCGGEKIIQMNVHRRKRNTSDRESYYSRGWTYQEFQMASRKLIFEGNMLYWECSCAEWHEYSTAEKQPTPRFGSVMKGLCDYDAYSELVRAYNERHFTYDADALDAINGILAVFGRSFTGGFLYGLPEMFFDLALTWRVSSFGAKESQSLRRRNVSSSPTKLPSWSWVGWQGPVIAVPLGTEDAGVEIHPTTTWYAGDTVTPYQGRRINACWYGQRQLFKDLSRPLPAGWKKHANIQPNGERIKTGGEPPGGGGDYYFTHDDVLDTEGNERKFWYPWPVTPITPDSELKVPLQSRYISCRTKRAWVEAYKRIVGDSATFPLRSSGEGIGELFLHHTGDEAGFSDDESVGRPVELVVICREVWASDADYYKVLWVEREGGVAYRKALGEVDKRWWDCYANAEDIDLVLG
ncbi:heterokaryon incompatibility protein-domain-containing protein [Xylaria grammica]|nr:heterokaryon incompatibility protein-domain-containing protein [Xylaria grammica]